MPSFTFASCANAVALRGARPVDALLALARRHGLRVIEDAAQAVDARYKGRYLGTLGDVGCYSFHATKNLSCGEGGAFLTNHDDLAQRAEIIREKGTNRQAFLRGEVDKYTWVAAGSSYVLSDLLAAILEAQLAKREAIRARRQALWNAYEEALAPLAAAGALSLPVIPQACDSNYHIFFVLTRTPTERGRLLSVLREEHIGATFHYVPLHSALYGREAYAPRAALPITEHASNTLVRLPLFPQLPPDVCRRILSAFRAALD